MILLDTNVVSQFSKSTPHPRVAQWLESVDPWATWISAITVAEMRLGVAQLAEGKRKTVLSNSVQQSLDLFAASCLPFDAVAAEAYARLVAARRRSGRPIGIMDAQIAAIAVATGCTLATLNVKDFEGIDGLKVVDPSQA